MDVPNKWIDDAVLSLAKALSKIPGRKVDRMEIHFQESGEHVYRLHIRDEQYPVPGVASARS